MWIFWVFSLSWTAADIYWWELNMNWKWSASVLSPSLRETPRLATEAAFSDSFQQISVSLTTVGNGDPLVQLVVIRHGVELAAQHLSKGGLVVLAGSGVTRAVPLPFPRAVLTSELRPVNDGVFELFAAGGHTAALLLGGHSYLGLLHSRSADCTPVPQVLEQWDHVLHWPQPPFTVSGSLPTITHSPEIHHWHRNEKRKQHFRLSNWDEPHSGNTPIVA